MTWLPNDPQLHAMALAFLHQMTTAILNADGELSPGELVFLDQEFPTHKMVMAGFVKPTTNAHTFEYYRAAARAFTELPAKLSKEERAQLFDQLKRAATAAAAVTPEEHDLLMAIKALFAA